MVANSSVREIVDMWAALKCFPLPDDLLATRPYDGAKWQRGVSRDPLHAQWLLPSTDEFRREIESVVDHDVSVGAGNLKLSDPRLAGDALTRRVVLLAVLNKVTINRFDNRGLLALINSLDTLTRWRLSLGVSCNADLTAQHFEALLRRLRTCSSIADLVQNSPETVDPAESEAKRSRSGAIGGDPDHSWLGGIGLTARPAATSKALQSSSSLQPEVAGSLPNLVDPSPKQGRCGSGRPLSVRRVQQFLRAWLVLADLSSRGLLPHDPLAFDPFGDGDDTISKIAERTGEAGFRLAIAPPYFLGMLNAAARWVLDYAPSVLDAYETMRDDPFLNATGGDKARQKAARRRELSLATDAKRPAGMPLLALTWRLDEALRIGGDQARMSMMQAVTHLMTACMILIAGFGARSISDALALDVDCVREVAPGQWELSLRLGPDVRDLDAMPVPSIVALAVGVMKKLTADTRAKTGDNRLFYFIRRASAISAGSQGQGFNLGFPKLRWLKDFATVNGLPEVDPETQAELTGDQLRLGFAVAYHFVFPTLPLEALTRALGMFDTSDALAYVERSLPGAAGRLANLIRARERTHRAVAGETAIDDLRALLTDLQTRMDGCESMRCEAALQLMKGIVNGTDLPVGAGGERLVLTIGELAESARRRVRVLGLNHPDAADYSVEEALRQFVRSNRADSVPGRHTRCLFRVEDKDDLAKAQCLVAAAEAVPWKQALDTETDISRPDFAYSGMVPCSRCEHGARFAADQAVVGAECDRLANGGGPAESAAAQAARLARFEDLLAGCPTQARGGGAP